MCFSERSIINEFHTKSQLAIIIKYTVLLKAADFGVI